MDKSQGRDLFIVDNSVSGCNSLRYLEEWRDIAKGFDIATGHFEIGALLALDGKWQQLDKIRILMGAETTHRTRKSLLEAVRKRSVEMLDASIETEKDTNAFLDGVPAILDALKSGGATEHLEIPLSRFTINNYHETIIISSVPSAGS